MHWDNWHMDGHMGGWMGLWWILIIAVIAALIWLAVAASRRGGESRDSPQQALKRRYANGDIDRDTYERISRT